MKCCKFFMVALFALLALTVSAQSAYQLRGRVVDKNGEPLIGATVVCKGNPQQGTVAGADGYFTLQVTAGETLVVSMLSYETAEVPVQGRRALVAELSDGNEQIEEVVVIGYGEQNAKDVTGAISSVNMAAIEQMPTADVSQALQGRMAGVVLSSNDGQPGEEMNLVIRGANSVTQDNSPLYVVDGFPTEDFSMMDLNPNDIKSISILRDASAGAIYGSRGANGVIIIETKSGRGKTAVNYSGSLAINQVANKLDVMDPYEYVRYVNELSPEYGKSLLEEREMTLEDYRNFPGYDWQDQIFQTALTHNHAVTVSGSSDNTQYIFSASYLNQEGVVRSTGYERFQGRIKVDQKITPKLTLGVNANYTYGETDGAIAAEAGSSTSSWQSYLMYRIWSFSPIDKGVLDSDEGDEAEVDVTKLNPVTSAINTMRLVEQKAFMSNLSLKYQLSPAWRWTSTFGMNHRLNEEKRFNGSKTYAGYEHKYNVNGLNGSYNTDTRREWVNENMLNFKKKFNRRHSLNGMAGFTLQNYTRSRYGYNVIKIPNDALGFSGLETGTPNKIRSTESQNRTMSFLGRLNYSLLSRYLFTVSFRADGSSKFPEDNRWGYFPSAAVAWRINQESFLRRAKWIDDLKLRLSWGITGNNRIGDFNYYSALDYVDHYPLGNATPSSAAGIASFANKALTWEETEQYDLGLDVALLRNRIRLTADVYRKTTRDLLLNAYIPYSTGLGTAQLNVGSVRNEGVELTLETVNVKTRKFTWTSSFNIAFNSNEVLELANNQQAFTTNLSWTGDFSATPLYITRVGGPISSFYGLIWDGVYQLEDFNQMPDGSYELKSTVPDNGNNRNIIQPGDIKYVDQNGDGTITNADMCVIGRTYPIHTGGFSNDFTWGNFTLGVFLQWSYGNDIMNANRIALEGNYAGRTVNQLMSYADRWSMDNQDSQNYRAGGYGPRGYYSTRTLEDGSYLRLKNISLAYNLPTKLIRKWGMSKAQLYVSLQNMWTITGYSGMDPEVSTHHSTLTPGFDYSAYPRNRTYTFGVKIGF
ncbi:MAG: TonB-dependent receptor [Alistipes sp.]|nr:TonB-dependent receptor [Alistipes sp.]